MQKGKVQVNTENIFPIIKKFLYTDHEIFLRELISNAVDASNKLKVLSTKGEKTGQTDDLKITVTLNSKKKTLTISDQGIGMTAEEIDKYINQIAFSGAEEFVEKYKDDKDSANIIGHFGLGFYSSFMVADKVEVISKSYKEDSEAAHWTCEGTTDFKIKKGKRKNRGTDIVLHINAESEEFLQSYRIQTLLNKYCKFLPIEIEFEDKVINNTTPLWKKNPAELTDEDYLNFYSELYPGSDKPLFWIHLNVDYPFNLTGVLYFPRIKREIEPHRNKIQLYSNQVFVTDNVEDIVPEYLLLLHGIIDSPDIPLNVSRSALQADGNVKKITGHISKKVADKLAELYKKDAKDFESKWESINLFVKYGMISDEKFYDRTKKICLLKDVDGTHAVMDDYIEKIKPTQTDKDGITVALYTTNLDEQFTYVQKAQDKGYNVLLMDEVIDNHFVSNIEHKLEKVMWKRVDSETVDKLIDKDEKTESVLSDDETNTLKEQFEGFVNTDTYTVTPVTLSPSDDFITITRGEWERRMSEMGGMQGMAMFGQLPEKYSMNINTNHALAKKVISAEEAERTNIMRNAFDLAKLAKNLLKGKDLSEFIKRQEAML